MAEKDPKAVTWWTRLFGRPDVDEESGHWFVEIVRTWGPAILAVIIIRTFIFEPFRIPSGSMVPTLLIGDHVVVTKFSYGIWLRSPPNIPLLDYPLTSHAFELYDLGNPQRGDIIVFQYPRNPSVNYIKRVVGLPGDKIVIRNNRIILNGVEQSTQRAGDFSFVEENCNLDPKRQYVEDLSGLKHSILTNSGQPGYLADKPEITVPADSVFVMGDNRDNSEDSRKWLWVRYDQIKGKAHRIWLSWDSCSGQWGQIRTDRFMQDLYGNVPAIAPVGAASPPAGVVVP